MAKKPRTFATPRATRWLSTRAAHHPDLAERESAAVMLGLLVRSLARNSAAQQGGRATAAKWQPRAAVICILADQLRQHGVPAEKLVESVRDEWRERKFPKPVPSERAVRRTLEKQRQEVAKAGPAGQG